MYYEELEQRTREHRSALMREAEQARLRAASRTQRHWRRSRAGLGNTSGHKRGRSSARQLIAWNPGPASFRTPGGAGVLGPKP